MKIYKPPPATHASPLRREMGLQLTEEEYVAVTKTTDGIC